MQRACVRALRACVHATGFAMSHIQLLDCSDPELAPGNTLTNQFQTSAGTHPAVIKTPFLEAPRNSYIYPLTIKISKGATPTDVASSDKLIST